HKARGKGARQTPHGEAWPTSAPDMPMPSATPARPEPAAPFFEDECRSLEEIPAQEYEPEYTAPKTAETRAPRHRTAERFRTAPEKDAIAAHAITDAPEEAAAIAEEFDLRQAVIYSEILKPRFDEE
ncbi:MAG: hypothetical protein U0N09_04195, partial [Alistipes dispar]